MADLINRRDNLNQGRIKINKSIEASERAESKSDEALNTANQAKEKSDDTQEQLDDLIIESGTTDAEVVQARGDYDLLYQRLNESDVQVSEARDGLIEIYEAIDETAVGVDVQGIDTASLESRGERLPVVLRGREAVEIVLLDSLSLRDTSIHALDINIDDLINYRDYDFFITNGLNADVRIAFSMDSFNTSVMLEDDNFVTYGVNTAHAFHNIPPGVRYVKLSDVWPKTGNNGIKTVNKTPFRGMYARQDRPFTLEYRAYGSTPTSGNLSIYFVGVPN